jgi:hypothetical protein
MIKTLALARKDADRCRQHTIPCCKNATTELARLPYQIDPSTH